MKKNKFPKIRNVIRNVIQNVILNVVVVVIVLVFSLSLSLSLIPSQLFSSPSQPSNPLPSQPSNPFPSQSSDPSTITLTIDLAIQRLLSCNREISDIQDMLARATINLDREKNSFGWKITPDAIFGYTNCQDSHHNTHHGHKNNTGDMTYGSGLGIAKKFAWGQRIYLHPSVQKKGDGYQAQMTASLVQPLLRGIGKGYTLSRLHSSEFALRNAYRQAYQKHVDLMQRTIQGLYNLVKQKEVVRINQESYQRLERFLQASRRKEKVGIANAMDVYRAELEVKSAEDRLTGSIDQLKDCEDQMREMLGYDQNIDLQVDVPLDNMIPVITPDEAIATALDHRVEVDLAKDALHEAKRLCHISKRDLWPELNLVLDYTNSYCYDRFRDILNWDKKDYWKVGFATSQDLDTYVDQSQFTLTRMAVEQSYRHIDRTHDMIVLEVKRAIRALERSQNQILIQEKQINSSEGSLKLSLLKFEQGMASNFDVIQAEKNLHQAQIQLFSSMIDVIINQLKLRVTLGVFAEKPNIAY